MTLEFKEFSKPKTTLTKTFLLKNHVPLRVVFFDENCIHIFFVLLDVKVIDKESTKPKEG